MFKKTLITSILIATTSTAALASPYMGGSIGATDLSIHRNGHLHSGGIGKVFAGNGETFGKYNNLYLATEINGDLAHYFQNSHAIYGLGASLIPGLLVTEVLMVFARIGIEHNAAVELHLLMWAIS